MTRRHPHGGEPIAALLAAVLLAACSGADPGSPVGARAVAGDTRATASSQASGSSPADSPPGSPTAAATPTPTPSPLERSRPAREPRRSHLTIPALGLRAIPVVRYLGRPDDAKGTRIQDRGPTASPRGAGGGVGPGEVGNFIITGHRTSHSAPFRDLPSLRRGDRVRVRSGSTVYVYRITTTRWTSFRSRRSLAEQSAAVPGRPGAEPVRPMITLSTCATPEDHAAGNYWADRFGNPEHRIDKIGVLVAQVPSA